MTLALRVKSLTLVLLHPALALMLLALLTSLILITAYFAISKKVDSLDKTTSDTVVDHQS